MPNPDVDVQLANPPPNSVLAGPDPVQSLFTLIAARLSAVIQGSYMPYVTGSATPAVNDQDKVWARVDNSGRPLGLYFYYNGNWRRVYSNAIGDLKFFQGDPTDAINGFDSSGLGVIGGMNDGWALSNGKNGTLDLSNYFIAGANMNASGGGAQFDTAAAAWLSYVNQLIVKDHGDENNGAGQAQALLKMTDLPTIRVILQGFAELSASNATKRAIVTGNYDVNNPHAQTLGVFGSNPTPLSTDPDTTVVPKTSVQTTPRWYAAAICRFVGY